MLDDVPFSMKAAQPREPQLLSSRFEWWPQLLEAGQSNRLGRYFMFVYDSFWQLRSSVQSVESPRGLELRLCQPSSRCPGSGRGEVAAHMLQRKTCATRVHSRRQIHTYMRSRLEVACTLVVRGEERGERVNHKCFQPILTSLLDRLTIKVKWRGGERVKGLIVQETQVKFFLDVVFLSPWHWLLFLSLAEQRRSQTLLPPSFLSLSLSLSLALSLSRY